MHEDNNSDIGRLRREYNALVEAGGMTVPMEAPSLSELYADTRDRAVAGDIARKVQAERLLELIDAEPSVVATISSASGRARPSQQGLSRKYQNLCDGTGKLTRYLDVIMEALSADKIEIPQSVYIDQYPTNQFNACVRRMPFGSLCLLNTGLLQLLNHVAMAAFCQVDDALCHDNIHVKFCLTSLYEYLIHNVHPAVFVENSFSDKSLIWEANAVAFAMKVFVLAHEIGHVVLGHNGSGDMPRTKEGSPHASVAHHHENEFAADAFAQRVLLRVDELNIFPYPVKGGGIGFLLVHAMANEAGAKLYDIPISVVETSESHPPPMERIRHLDDMLMAFIANSAADRNDLSPIVLLQRCLIDLQNKNFVLNSD